MQIAKPIVSLIAKETWCINEFGMDAMFLLTGSHRALLIDTGTGTFDIKGLCETLTDKPLTVVCTHSHVDHVGGIGFFDTVYMHKADFEAARALTVEDRKSYTRTIGALQDLFAVDEKDVVVFDSFPELQPLREGDIIDLGDRKVIVYETPGHTPGSISFLDVRERILYNGDACCRNTILCPFGIVLKHIGVRTLLETAKKLKQLEPYYDRSYNGHIGFAANLDCVPQDFSTNTDAIEVCTGILDGSIVGELQTALNAGNSYYFKKGAFGIRYDPAQIW